MKVLGDRGVSDVEFVRSGWVVDAGMNGKAENKDNDDADDDDESFD